jgi:hypothetical protein
MTEARRSSRPKGPKPLRCEEAAAKILRVTAHAPVLISDGGALLGDRRVLRLGLRRLGDDNPHGPVSGSTK